MEKQSETISGRGIGFSGSGMFPISDRVKQVVASLIKSEPKTNINETKLIKTWSELKSIESDTHIIEVDEYSGWIRPKNENKENYWKDNHYLGTHTFYGHNYTYSTRILQECGFNVQLENWDGETIWYDRDEFLELERQFHDYEKFNEQDLYDKINKLTNVRYEKPKFIKCESCGFEVVDYQIKDGICDDCRRAV